MKKLISAGIIVGIVLSIAVAQGNAELDRLDEKISSHLATQFPGWRHKRVEPVAPSSTVLVQFWSSANRVVKVSVAIHHSTEEAKREIQDFLKFRQPQELRGFGDEAFAAEPEGRTIVFRRGRYVIYLSTVADVEGDSDAASLSKAERETRQKAEVQRIGKEFARQVSSIEFQ